MTTTQATLRPHIHQLLFDNFPNSVSLQDILSYVDSNLEWDDEDRTPPTVDGVPQNYPSWNRNVRNVLGQDVNRRGVLLRTARGMYAWPTNSVDSSLPRPIENETPQIPIAVMQFPEEILSIMSQLRDDRLLGEDAVEEVVVESQGNDDTRGIVYVLWSPSFPDWVVTGKGIDEDRCRAYNTYTPHRDFEVVGISVVDNRSLAEENLQNTLDDEFPNRRGESSGRRPEWFRITTEEAYEVLERLNPNSTHRSSS